MRTMRRVLLAVAATGLAAGMLTGCGDDGSTEAPGPTETPVTAKTATELGPTLERAVYSGLNASDDKGVCFAKAVLGTDLSPEAQQTIVDTGGDSWGALVTAVRESDGEEDAQVLLSESLTEALDACVIAQFGPGEDETVTAITADAPKEVETSTSEPNTKAKYTIDTEYALRSADEVEPGLISMFSSFGNDDATEVIKGSSKCMASVVFEAGFSDETLKFIAGGAPLGSGSIVDHLKTKEDKTIWTSASFKSSLSTCAVRGDAATEDEED